MDGEELKKLRHHSNRVELKMEHQFSSIIQGDEIHFMNRDEIQSSAPASLDMNGNSAALDVNLICVVIADDSSSLVDSLRKHFRA